MSRLSLVRKRIVVGVALLQMLFFLANYYFLHLFGQLDKKIFVISGIVTGACVLFFGPTVDELRANRDKEQRSTS